METKVTDHVELHCSFCGKGRSQVATLVAGPSVYICDECINLCHQVIYDDDDYEDREEWNGPSGEVRMQGYKERKRSE